VGCAHNGQPGAVLAGSHSSEDFTMRITLHFVALLATLGLAPGLHAGPKPFTLDVWPGKAPGETGAIGEEKVLPDKPGQRTVKRLTNITRPTLTVFRPDKAKDMGAAVLVAPGGGYSILAWDLEGEEVAARSAVPTGCATRGS